MISPSTTSPPFIALAPPPPPPRPGLIVYSSNARQTLSQVSIEERKKSSVKSSDQAVEYRFPICGVWKVEGGVR